MNNVHARRTREHIEDCQAERCDLLGDIAGDPEQGIRGDLDLRIEQIRRRFGEQQLPPGWLEAMYHMRDALRRYNREHRAMLRQRWVSADDVVTNRTTVRLDRRGRLVQLRMRYE